MTTTDRTPFIPKLAQPHPDTQVAAPVLDSGWMPVSWSVDSMSCRYGITRRLAYLRKANGFSQAALARAIGRPPNRIAQLETGRVRLLFQEAIVIAAVLGVEVTALDPSRGLRSGSVTQLTLDDFVATTESSAENIVAVPHCA